MDEPVNAAYGKDEKPAEPRKPLYIAGYRIPTDKIWMFLAANVLFVVAIVFITVLVLPLGIPFLAVKRSEGFVTYVGFFFTYMFGYFAFFLLMALTLGASGYALQQRYFPTPPAEAAAVTPADSTTSAPATTA
jgi:hypothetical protein